MKVEKNNNIYADFSLNFTKPLENDIQIDKIKCTLLLENSVELAKGNTLSSFIAPKNVSRIENLSFLFEVSDIKSLIEAFLRQENFTITGKIIFPLGFSYPFSVKTQEIGSGFLPTISIQELHPLPPGSLLEIVIETSNPHEISLNITEGQFQLFSPEYGNLGVATLANLSMLPNISNGTLYLETNTSQLTWMFEKILNNGTIQTKIQNLDAVFDFAGQYIPIFTKEGPFFTWESFSPSLQILEIENISILHFAFDLVIGFQGEPLWGYNISYNPGKSSAISLDFYYKLISNPEPQIVGSGISNRTIFIKRHTSTNVSLHVTVNLNALEMLLDYAFGGKIEIDIRNGILNLQFYEVFFEVEFNRTLSY
jgi:LEA14-like dessication related protein